MFHLYLRPKKKHTHFLSFKKKPPPGPWWVRGTTETVPLLRDQGSSHQPLTKRSPVQQHGLHPLCHSGRRKVGGALSVFRCQKFAKHQLGCGLVEVESFTTPINSVIHLINGVRLKSSSTFFLWNGFFCAISQAKSLSGVFARTYCNPVSGVQDAFDISVPVG